MEYKELLEKGLCPSCYKERDDLSKFKCSKCRKRAAERRAWKKANGFCQVCSSIKEDFSKFACNSCLKKHADRNLSLQIKRKANFKCAHCGGPKEDEFIYCLGCRVKRQQKDLEIKVDVFTHYGGRCECCGENMWWFLVIDHVLNDGKAHRQKIGSHIYRDLQKRNYPEGYRVLCANCNSARYHVGKCPHTFQEKIEYKDKWYYQDKLKALKAYGVSCACCGESNERFLCVDHINNNGFEERKKLNSKGGASFYRWLRRNNYPVGYQILCFNCNQGKKLCNGTCPHQLPADKSISPSLSSKNQ